MYVFQRITPLSRSRATTLPRKLQQGYRPPETDCAASASSCEAVPTYTRPSKAIADWVMIAAGCDSTCVDHRSAPVFLSKASTFPPPPKGPCVPRITLLPLTTGVARALSKGTPDAAGMEAFQTCWPVLRSSA